MFLQPSRDIALLNSRLDVVQFCVEPKNEELVQNMLVCLQNIKSIVVRYLYQFFVPAVYCCAPVFNAPERGLSSYVITHLKIPIIYVAMHFGIRKTYVS